MGHFPWLCQIMRGHHWPLEMVTDVWITFERHRFFGINIVLLGKNRSGRVWHTIHHHVRNLAVNGVWLLCYPINPVCESVVRNLGMSTQKSMMFDDFDASDPLHILLNNLQEMMVFWCSLMFIDGFLIAVVRKIPSPVTKNRHDWTRSKTWANELVEKMCPKTTWRCQKWEFSVKTTI
jgi:hypothetical protein